ncbi:hypothetical protein [Pinibacter soli]|uniref:Uncharacterized protein n=1 Tax=Pinibacter soli TaxID=3044211 RepID=A0ABT6RDF3_9BACT|nr:hypothetical protein [Pinibacter soli]MDI3320603.1 hypothetical protein [Pinibacter soli]
MKNRSEVKFAKVFPIKKRRLLVPHTRYTALHANIAYFRCLGENSFAPSLHQ